MKAIGGAIPSHSSRVNLVKHSCKHCANRKFYYKNSMLDNFLCKRDLIFFATI